MRWTGDTVWVLSYVTGPARDLTGLRALLEEPPRPPVLETHIVEQDASGIYYYTRWTRPAGTDGAVSIEHLMLDVLGPEAVLDASIRDGHMAYRVVAEDGAKLQEFFNVVRSRLEGRFQVRLQRVGEMRGKLRGAPGTEASLRREDQDLLREALVRGYYDNPKKCGLRELGDALGFSKSSIARKLRTLERRALETFATSEPTNPHLRGR